jgi:membrane protein implicated in regulation of membrane protease activity
MAAKNNLTDSTRQVYYSMSNSSTQSASGGIGFGGVLTILFIGLKLTGHIDWFWWWVLSPLWIPLALLLAIFVVGAALLGLASVAVAAVKRIVGSSKRSRNPSRR